MHIFSLWYLWFSLDMLLWKVVRHAGLAVRHIDLEGSVAGLSVQFNFFKDKIILVLSAAIQVLSSLIWLAVIYIDAVDIEVFWEVFLRRPICCNEPVMVSGPRWDIVVGVLVFQARWFYSAAEHTCFQVCHLGLITGCHRWLSERLVSNLQVVIVLLLLWVLIYGLVIKDLLVRMVWVKHFVLAHWCTSWHLHLCCLVQLLLSRLELWRLLRADHWHVMLIHCYLCMRIICMSLWVRTSSLDLDGLGCLTGLGADGRRVEQARLPLVRVELSGLLDWLVFPHRVRSMKRRSVGVFAIPHKLLLRGRIIHLTR